MHMHPIYILYNIPPGTTDFTHRPQVGERLFAAVFVLHGGFLPSEEDVPVAPHGGSVWRFLRGGAWTLCFFRGDDEP